MSDSVQELHIHIGEWPTREDIQEFTHQNDSHRKISEYLTQEFDTMISFSVKGTDLLSGYNEAFFLPLHALVRQLSRAVKALDRDGEVAFPIYLQQYEIKEGDPAHTMKWKRSGNVLHVSMEWGGQVDAPDVIRSFQGVEVDAGVFRTTVVEFLDLYARKVMMLLGRHADWTGEEISVLFEEF